VPGAPAVALEPVIAHEAIGAQEPVPGSARQ
jgi:hypothetical protein